jgi:hypothetical protein
MNQLDEIVRAFEGAVANPASPLHFTPVQVRARLDGWTPERQRTFVAALAATGRADRAAAYVGMTENTAARLRRRPDGHSFACACVAASSVAARIRRQTAAAHAQAAKGPKRPKGFPLKGCALSETSGPFGPSAPPFAMPSRG